ncbi:MAG: hypothetical protein ACTHU0_40000 [Kofleriaceae bacterium]
MSEHGHAISALFTSRDDVEQAISDLVEAGVPRDQIEVSVSPLGNEAHFRGRARRLGSQTVRYAAAGALIGLLLGIVMSLEIILVFPGIEPPAHELSLAQLLGPNVAMMIGLVLGAVVGAFRKRSGDGPAARIADSDDILVAVRSQSDARLPELTRLLASAGGREPLVQAEQRHRSRRWYLG